MEWSQAEGNGQANKMDLQLCGASLVSPGTAGDTEGISS